MGGDDAFETYDDDSDGEFAMSPILATRLLQYIRGDVDLRGEFEDVDDKELLEELVRDSELLNDVFILYKAKRWKKLRHAIGALPATSLQELDRLSRKGDEKFLILCGWHNPDGGICGECAYCGVPLEIHEVTVDHLIPISQGGEEELSNLLPACLDCNDAKADKSAEEFLASQGLSQEDIDDWTVDVLDALRFRERHGLIWQMRLSPGQMDRLGLNETTEGKVE